MTLYLTTMTVVAGVTETGGHTRSHCQGQVTEVQAPALHWYRPDSMMQFRLSVQSAVSPSCRSIDKHGYSQHLEKGPS